jgi:hypothetical protein
MTTTHNPLILNGGADRDRTGDLQSAILALSQLSYCPLFHFFKKRLSFGPISGCFKP